MQPRRIALLLVGPWSLAAALSSTAAATVVLIEYSDHNGAGGFPNNGGPRWSGVVDTLANTLTIHTWTDLPGTPEFWTPWTPNLAASPLVWPAVSSTGAPYDVPDDFVGRIDATFGFISTESAQNILWNEGVWGDSPTFTLPPEIDFYPGWGGVRRPVSFNGEIVLVFDTSADETEMPLLPIAPLGLAASTGATVTAHVASNVGGTAVPEASAILFGCVACGVGSCVAGWRTLRRRYARRPGVASGR